MLTVFPIPAFKDNYIWALHNDRYALLVDPGDPAPCIEFLRQRNLRLAAILNTHHHGDHTGGNNLLAQMFAPRIVGPADEDIPSRTEIATDNSIIGIPELDLQFQVIATPGHTLGHVSYYGANRLFCGDTLFGCGCGRLFEGTPGVMFDSLARLAQLPADTAIHCAHEYTLDNIRFALAVDPANPSLLTRQADDKRKRAEGRPTLPSELALEKATNPFLRCTEPALWQAAKRHLQRPPASAVEVFAALRGMKDHFQ